MGEAYVLIAVLVGLGLGLLIGFYYGRLWVLVRLKDKEPTEVIREITTPEKPRHSPPPVHRPMRIRPVRIVPEEEPENANGD